MCDRFVDFIDLKSYDYHTAEKPVTGFSAPLSSGSQDNGADAYLNVVREKLELVHQKSCSLLEFLCIKARSS
jgi:GH18 family chitinase